MKMCPHCGFNFEADKRISREGWVLDPVRSVAVYRERVVTRRMSWVLILHTLAKADGALVSLDALLNRVSDSENPNAASSTLSQLRHHLRRQGVEPPFNKGVPERNSQGVAWVVHNG